MACKAGSEFSKCNYSQRNLSKADAMKEHHGMSVCLYFMSLQYILVGHVTCTCHNATVSELLLVVRHAHWQFLKLRMLDTLQLLYPATPVGNLLGRFYFLLYVAIWRNPHQ